MSDSDSSSIFNIDELIRLNIDFNTLGVTGVCKHMERIKKPSSGIYGKRLYTNNQTNDIEQKNNSIDKTTSDTTVEYTYDEPLTDSISGTDIIKKALEVMKKDREFQSNGFLEFLLNKPYNNPKISMWKKLKSEFGIQVTLLTPKEELLIESCCSDALGVLGCGVFEEYKRKRLEECKQISCEKHEEVPCKKKSRPNSRRKILPN